MKLRVSILGAGAAGIALAAELGSRHIDVLLYSHVDHRRHIDEVLVKGHLKVTGALDCETSLDTTSDIADAVQFSTILLITVPSSGQETILNELRQFDLRQHLIIAVPGNMFSLIAASKIEAAGIFETNISPYSCRMQDGVLIVLGKKQSCLIASRAPYKDSEYHRLAKSVLPLDLIWCENIIEVCLSNINGVFHPLMMLLNAGRIESTAGDFLLYRDGLTRSVANAMLAVDRVRLEIGTAFGFKMKTATETSNDLYGQDFQDLVSLAQLSPPHNTLRAPDSLYNRNIHEDVPDLLVCWYGLAEKLGINSQPLRTVIDLAEMCTGTNFMTSGRNLTQLQLDHLGRNELLQMFGTGATRARNPLPGLVAKTAFQVIIEEIKI